MATRDPTFDRLVNGNSVYRTDYDDDKADSYKIVRRLDQGSEGMAILIEGKKSGRRHVYKLRVTREQKVLPREIVMHWDLLQHNLNMDRGVSLVKVIDFWFTRPTENVMLMEYCEEGDLHDFLDKQLFKRRGALGTQKFYKLPNYFIAHVIAHCINGLMYLHTGREWNFTKNEWRKPAENWSGAIVHKDITLTNIFIRNTRRVRRLKDPFDLPEFCIGDLGFACPLNQDHRYALEFRNDLPNDVFLENFETERLGNPNYTPPEYLVAPYNGKTCNLSVQTDVYMLGQCFYELMTGENGFPGMTISQHQNRKVTDHYDASLAALVDAMTNINPDVRIRTHELSKCMSDIITMRERYAEVEHKMPEWSFPHWRPKPGGKIGKALRPTGSATMSAMQYDAIKKKKAEGWMELEPKQLPLKTDMAIRAIGGSRKQYRRMSEDRDELPSMVDAARLSLPQESIVRASILEMMGATPPPSRSSSTASLPTRTRPPPSRHRHGTTSHGNQRKKSPRRNSSPTASGEIPAKPACPKCSILRARKLNHKGKAKARDDDFDFGCQGLKGEDLFCTCDMNDSSSKSTLDSDATSSSSIERHLASFRAQPILKVQAVQKSGVVHEQFGTHRPESFKASVDWF